jgi:hypothetical protein
MLPELLDDRAQMSFTAFTEWLNRQRISLPCWNGDNATIRQIVVGWTNFINFMWIRHRRNCSWRCIRELHSRAKNTCMGRLNGLTYDIYISGSTNLEGMNKRPN